MLVFHSIAINFSFGTLVPDNEELSVQDVQILYLFLLVVFHLQNQDNLVYCLLKQESYPIR